MLLQLGYQPAELFGQAVEMKDIPLIDDLSLPPGQSAVTGKAYSPPELDYLHHKEPPPLFLLYIVINYSANYIQLKKFANKQLFWYYLTCFGAQHV